MNESALRELLDVWEELADRERRAVCLFAKRTLQGQRCYGPLRPGKRNWSLETVEEGIDAAAYLTYLALDLMDDK